LKKIFFIALFLSNVYASQYDYNELLSKKFYKADITALEAFDMKVNGVLLIDVRTKNEYNFARVDGSLWVPIFFDKSGRRVLNENFVEQIEYILKDKNKKVMLICRSGARTKFAANILAKNGFTKVYNILNGLSDKGGWIDSRLKYWRSY
jgi:rhodanese-related sulfurtransferase